MARKKSFTIDPNDLGYEEEFEEIGFDSPGEIKGNLVEGFAFTNDPVVFSPAIETKPIKSTPHPKVLNQTKTNKTNSNQNIFDMRKLSVINGVTPPVDGEKLEYKRCYMLRFSTLKKLEHLKALHPEIVYMSSLVDIAINHYYECLTDNR